LEKAWVVFQEVKQTGTGDIVKHAVRSFDERAFNQPDATGVKLES
jgi:hypothetical protein